jgi:hypothetical protein
MKLLIDECLSPKLAKMAQELGYEASHVVWLGMSGYKDWNLVPVILKGDWTFVTRNSIDFRGPKSNPGTKGQYSKVEVHAGLICLNSAVAMDIELQSELFRKALEELKSGPDLVNQVLDVTATEDEIEVLRRSLPTSSREPLGVISFEHYQSPDAANDSKDSNESETGESA